VRRDGAAQGATEAPVRVEFQVEFSRGPRGKRRVQAEACAAPSAVESGGQRIEHHAGQQPGPRPALPVDTPKVAVLEAVIPRRPKARVPTATVPKIALLLVLGHHFERLVRDGVVKDYAEIARRAGLTRARVTQITNLTLLAPRIQERILCAESGDILPRERALRSLATTHDFQRVGTSTK